MSKPLISAKQAYIEAQMNRREFKVLHTINLDWFEVMASGAFIDGGQAEEKYEFDNGRIVLAMKGHGTKIFKYSYEIFFKGKLFGKCHCHPRAAEILKPDYIQFQVSNNVLYEAGGFTDIKYFFKALHWKVLNITRFDIALDGVKVIDLVDQFVMGKIEKLGKAKVRPYFTGKREMEGFDIGSRASNKWITGYMKCEELEKTGKTYIKEFWERTGLDITGKVERLELKVRSEEVKKISGFNWEDLDNFEYLATIFRTCMKNFFEFVYLGGDTNVTRKQKIEFINWDFLGASLLDRLSTRETTEIYRMKQAAKTNFWCYLASGRNYYADIAQEQAMNVNCLDWYANSLEKWKTEYYKRCGHNQDGLISFQYYLHFETYEDNTQLELFEIHKPGKI